MELQYRMYRSRVPGGPREFTSSWMPLNEETKDGLTVMLKGGGFVGFETRERPSEPPLKVGDIVPLYRVDELPFFSVVVSDGRDAYQKLHAGWKCAADRDGQTFDLSRAEYGRGKLTYVFDGSEFDS